MAPVYLFRLAKVYGVLMRYLTIYLVGFLQHLPVTVILRIGLM